MLRQQREEIRTETVTSHMAIQLPIAIRKARKREVRTQFAALIYRVRNGKIQILLITSRRTGRWIIPKGWPMLGKRPAEAAAQEAWEEAGIRGKALPQCLGVFSYYKNTSIERSLPCLVMVYPLRAKRLEKDFPEKGQRKRKWFSQKKAAKLVKEPELVKIIETFDPHVLK
ncbi:NUDIX hydrolase [Cognatishimia sp. WU-CL00825]